MTARRRWTTRETAFLRENADSMSLTEIAAHLNRTANAVQIRARTIGVTVEPYWTAEDEQLLRVRFPDLTSVAEQLGRTFDAVRRKANRMGLFLTTPHRGWTRAEIERVRNEFGRRPTEDLAREMNRTVPSVRIRAHKLGLGYWPADLPAETQELLWSLRDHPDVESFLSAQLEIPAPRIRALLARMREAGGPLVTVTPPV